MKDTKLVIIPVIMAILVLVVSIGLFFKKDGNGEVIEITYSEYSEKIENKETFVLFLWQTGCSHCESFEPKIEKVVNDYGLKIYSINLANLSDSEYAKIKNKTFITGTPTTVYIKNGVVASTKLVGNKDKNMIIDFLKEHEIIK